MKIAGLLSIALRVGSGDRPLPPASRIQWEAPITDATPAATDADHESQNASFDVVDLSARLSKSRSHLHRCLTEIFGLAPSELIIRFPFERAARMLASGAGCAVGCCDASHFVRRFREQYGQTPAAYAAATRASGGAPSGGTA